MHMATTEDILDRLTTLTEQSRQSFDKLEGEVQLIKDQRFKPYFASAGAFLIVVMGVMGYVYALETRLTAVLFSLNAKVAVVHERVNVVDDRLRSRTDTMALRWDTHAQRHKTLDDGLRVLANKLLVPRYNDDEKFDDLEK